MDNNIVRTINLFIKDYTEMNINGTIINCPYWMNKIVAGRVKIRGFANGKGEAISIKNELIKKLNNLSDDTKFSVNALNLQKFAKRERIGIDCSGLVYRIIEELVRLKYGSCKINFITDIYKGGINGTNAATLTSDIYCKKVSDISKCRLGDLIRINGGKHVAMIVDLNDGFIEYIHSHGSTKVQGVHRERIKIIDSSKTLDYQEWQESMRRGDNFGIMKFKSSQGDGIYRLKIFDHK